MRLQAFLGILSALKKLHTVKAAPNAFISPLDDFAIHAGQTMEINWIDPIGETVHLALLTGSPENLQRVVSIVDDIPNEGYAVWKVPTEVQPGRYSMEIVANDGSINYSPFFTITDAVSPANFQTTKQVRKDEPKKIKNKPSILSRWFGSNA